MDRFEFYKSFKIHTLNKSTYMYELVAVHIKTLSFLLKNCLNMTQF